MQRRCRIIAALLMAGVSTTYPQPATNPPTMAGLTNSISERLTLAEAEKTAFLRNWDLLAARSDVDAATAQKIVARQFPNPSLALSVTKISVDNHGNSTPEGNDFWSRSYDTVAAINQLFEIGGKRSSRKASAEAGLEGAQARLMDAKRLLDLAVAKAYVAAAQAEANVQVLKQSAQSLRQEADIAATRLKAGDISSSDKSRIEIEADRLELDARSTETAAVSARIALETLLGVAKPKGQVVLADTLENLCEISSPAEPAPPGAARADLLAAEAALRKAEADLRQQKALRYPDPTLFSQYEHEPPELPNTIGFGVSFPLPLWNRNRGGIQAAEAAREQARVVLEKIKAQIAADIATARLAYDDSRKRLLTYRGSIRPKSEEIRKTVAFAYQKGGASLLDLLSAERNDNDVRLAAAQAASNTAVAAAALKAALNVMEPPKITK